MPCTKCENEKYKWGKTGECKYDSKEACEKANKKNYNKMRPTPLGKTYEQYEKELKEYNLSKVERVELGSVKELKEKSKKLIKAMKDADNAWRNYQDYLSLADKPYVKMIDAYNELDPAISFSEGTIKRFAKAAKELGVKATDNKDYVDLEADIKEAEVMIKIINSFKDPSSFQ